MRFAHHGGIGVHLGDAELIALNEVVSGCRDLGDAFGRDIDLIGMEEPSQSAETCNGGTGAAHHSFLRPIQRIQCMDSIGVAFFRRAKDKASERKEAGRCKRLLRECGNRGLEQFIEYAPVTVIRLGIQGVRPDDQIGEPCELFRHDVTGACMFGATFDDPIVGERYMVVPVADDAVSAERCGEGRAVTLGLKLQYRCIPCVRHDRICSGSVRQGGGDAKILVVVGGRIPATSADGGCDLPTHAAPTDHSVREVVRNASFRVVDRRCSSVS